MPTGNPAASLIHCVSNTQTNSCFSSYVESPRQSRMSKDTSRLKSSTPPRYACATTAIFRMIGTSKYAGAAAWSAAVSEPRAISKIYQISVDAVCKHDSPFAGGGCKEKPSRVGATSHKIDRIKVCYRHEPGVASPGVDSGCVTGRHESPCELEWRQWPC